MQLVKLCHAIRLTSKEHIHTAVVFTKQPFQFQKEESKRGKEHTNVYRRLMHEKVKAESFFL